MEIKKKALIPKANLIIFLKWEKLIQISKKKLLDDIVIQTERENEMQKFVNLIISLKKDDTKKFKSIIRSLIQILSEDSLSSDIKLKTMTILRKLSNYKNDSVIIESILKDLGELGFTNFLCDLISSEENHEQKLEYIKGFVEYIDDSSREVQASFYNYLQED